MAATPDLAIVPLTPERFGDLAVLFEEGGDPKWCWCTYFRVRGRDWTNSTAQTNRQELESRADDDPPAGLLAYDGDRVVGWVSLGPRATYERLEASRVLAPVDGRPTWSIVCFVVSKAARGHGVARAMLDAAIEHARAHGATTAGGLSGRHRGRAGPRRERLPRHAAHVRGGRVRGGRPSPGERLVAGAAHRPARDPSLIYVIRPVRTTVVRPG